MGVFVFGTAKYFHDYMLPSAEFDVQTYITEQVAQQGD